MIVSEATFPGCVIRARPVALFAMSDEEGPDEKVVCVPLSDPHWNTVESMDDLPQRRADEIEHFFSIYKGPIGKHVKVEGWYSKERAIEIIEECRERERLRLEALKAAELAAAARRPSARSPPMPRSAVAAHSPRAPRAGASSG